MSQGNPGFLTDTHREYLAADNKKRKEMRERNPNIPRRIRGRLNGAEEDWALIMSSDANLLKGLDMTTQRVGSMTTRTDAKVQTGLKAMLGQASAYSNNDVIDLEGKSPDKVLDDLERKQDQMREYMAKCVVRSLIDSSEDIEGFSDEQLRRFVEIVFPSEQQAQEIIIEEFSDL
jgi:hypothetical protein